MERGADIQDFDNKALIYTSWGGEIETVKYLVEHGADIHAQDDMALKRSVFRNKNVTKYLLEHGANIHSEFDDTLAAAIEIEDLELVKYLVENGANIHARDHIPGKAFLEKARIMKHKNIVEYLESL